VLQWRDTIFKEVTAEVVTAEVVTVVAAIIS